MNKSVLIVEDHEIYRDILVDLLDCNYQTFTTESGETALKIVQRQKLDLILLDLYLVDINGLEVIQRIRGGIYRDMAIRSIPIIVTTTHYEENNIIQALRMGGNDVLMKPIIPELLYLTLAKHIEPYSSEPNRRKSILICDPINSEINKLLNVIGDEYDVITTNSAEETIHMLNDSTVMPDMFVFDIVLGGKMDGLELTKYVRSNRHIKNKPVLINTLERSSFHDEINSRKAGADGFVVKSLHSAEVIMARIRSLT